MKLSAGKLRGMHRLADENGIWRMLALDQRTPMVGPIALKRGTKEAAYEDVSRTKEVLAAELADKASAVLLDTVFGWPNCMASVPGRTGLMLAIEHTVTEQTPGGRKTSDIPDLTVAKIKRMGGDAVKLLAWYRADAAPEVKAHQQAYVRATGQACADQDIVFLLELLVYPLPGEDAAAYAAARTHHVIAAVKDFVDPSYQVDIYKLETPISTSNVPDPDGPDAAEALKSFNEMAALLPRPWVLLSAGASPTDFENTLKLAYRAGASGYLAGRSIWANAFDHFPDWDAMSKTAARDSVPYMDKLNELSTKLATPWEDHACWQGAIEIENAGPAFNRLYQEA